MVEIVKQPTALTVVTHGERGRPAGNLAVRAYFDFENLLSQIGQATQPASPATQPSSTAAAAAAQVAGLEKVEWPDHRELNFTVVSTERPEKRDASSFAAIMPEIFQAPYLDETPPEDAWFENRTRLSLLGIA
jgi:hypothetical protein